MIRALFKKQLAEAFSRMLMRGKKSRKRSGGARIGLIALYVGLLAYLGLAFYFLARTMCEPLIKAGMGWLGFALSLLVSIILGVVGSVFSTYGSLYGAKDNDILLAMPIPVWALLLSRLFSVYLMGLIYQLPVVVPTLIVWFTYADLSVLGVVFSLLIPFFLSFIVLVLSCLMGFIVALVSVKVKHKNIINTVLALTVLGLYMVLYNKVYSMLGEVMLYADAMAGKVKALLYPFYHMGRAAEGNPLSMLIFVSIVIALVALTYLVLSRTFLRLSITKVGTARKKYEEKPIKASGANGALLRREMKRFVSSSTYMLNCGLGIVVSVAAGVFVLIKAGDMASFLSFAPALLEEGTLPLVGAAVICLLSCTASMTAPSISLEGKQIWLIRVLPVSARQVLAAKIWMHLVLMALPMAFLSATVLIALRPSVAFCVLIPLMAVAFTVWVAVFGLCMNLKFYNLNWSNEAAPIKHSVSTFLALFGGWVLVGLLGLAYYLLYGTIASWVFLLICVVAITLSNVGMLWWISRRGTRIFESLS